MSKYIYKRTFVKKDIKKIAELPTSYLHELSLAYCSVFNAHAYTIELY